MNYLEPDEIWKRFQVNSETDFIEKYVLKGRFHSSVPEKIVEEYLTVQRLLYYSYFSYPLFDEAFSKAILLFEASVTLKLEEAGLERKGFETLQSKLNRLKKDCSKELFEQWQHAKELRNSFAHRKAGQRMGIFLANGFKHNLNLINTLFLDPLTIAEKENRLADLTLRSKHFEKGVFALNVGNNKILLCGAKPYSVGILKNNSQSLWVLIPITGEGAITKSSDMPKSFILKLENVQLENGTLSAIDYASRQSLQITETDKPENLEKLASHNQRMKSLESISPDISFEYMASLKSSIAGEISNFLYQSW